MAITLAIETSCDDTSISILDGIEVISIKTFSQIKNHAKFGGVIPELASRLHSENIFKIIDEALEDANTEIRHIDRIAVTGGPGLVNTLQVGITVAKTLSLILSVPLYDIDHIEAHVYSPFINKEYKTIPKNAIVLIVSGGHTEIFIKEKWNYKMLGKTKDDSIGEVYDKIAKFYGYSYPGGKILDDIANNTNKKEEKIPVTKLEGYNFSYSGIKSHMINKLKTKEFNTESLIRGFQTSAIKQLLLKVEKAVKEFGINNIIIGGGVSANETLRTEILKNRNWNVFLPKMKFTGDNAAMIGYLAEIKITHGNLKKSNIKMDAKPRREI